MPCISVRSAGIAFALLLSAMPLPSAADPSEDEPESTMEVLDDLSDVGDSASESRNTGVTGEDEEAVRYDVFGERIGGAETEDDSNPEISADEVRRETGPRDDFEHDDIDEADRQRELASEHDFEDGEEVDYDEYDAADEP